jgi:mRNA-degrading endonuclease YafQ of YafQ-DinJ toxin-antitoxin module
MGGTNNIINYTNRFKKGISRWIKSKNFIKKTIKTILSSLRSQNYFLSSWQKGFLLIERFY